MRPEAAPETAARHRPLPKLDLRSIPIPPGPAPPSARIQGWCEKDEPPAHRVHHPDQPAAASALAADSASVSERIGEHAQQSHPAKKTPKASGGVIASAAPELRDLQKEAAAFTPASVRSRGRRKGMGRE